jgi:hypothetical protein
MSGLSERDLRQLIAVVEDGRRDEPTAGIPWAVLDRMADLVPGAEFSWVELDRAARHRPVQQDRGEGGERILDLDLDEPDAEAYWQHYQAFLPPQR